MALQVFFDINCKLKCFLNSLRSSDRKSVKFHSLFFKYQQVTKKIYPHVMRQYEKDVLERNAKCSVDIAQTIMGWYYHFQHMTPCPQ